MVQDGPLLPGNPGYLGTFARAPQLPLPKQKRIAPANLVFGEQIVELGQRPERCLIHHQVALHPMPIQTPAMPTPRIEASNKSSTSRSCFSIRGLPRKDADAATWPLRPA